MKRFCFWKIKDFPSLLSFTTRYSYILVHWLHVAVQKTCVSTHIHSLHILVSNVCHKIMESCSWLCERAWTPTDGHDFLKFGRSNWRELVQIVPFIDCSTEEVLSSSFLICLWVIDQLLDRVESSIQFTQLWRVRLCKWALGVYKIVYVKQLELVTKHG